MDRDAAYSRQKKHRRDLERDEERVEQDDELERAPTTRRNVGANDANA